MNADNHSFEVPFDENLNMDNFRHRSQGRIIIIEGVDRTGKTTLQERLKRHYDYAHLVIVRGPVGLKAYNHIYKRNVGEAYYDLMESSFRKLKAYMLYLYADINTIEKRIKEEKGPRIDVKGDLEVYEHYYKESILDKYKINTAHHNMDGVFDIAVRVLDEYFYKLKN